MKRVNQATEKELLEMRENGELDAYVEIARRERYWVTYNKAIELVVGSRSLRAIISYDEIDVVNFCHRMASKTHGRIPETPIDPR